MSVPVYLRVAIPSPLRRTFDYLPPQSPPAAAALQPGIRVRVPFGRQEVVGVLLETGTHTDLEPGQLRQALALVDDTPVLPPDLLQLCRWVSDYYQHPLGEVVSTALPALLRKGEAADPGGETVWGLTAEARGLPETAFKRAPKQAALFRALLARGQLGRAELEALELSRNAVKALADKGLVSEQTRPPTPPARADDPLREAPLALNPEQQAALDQLRYQAFNTYLLEGATGSGKTEIYLQAIQAVLSLGRQALVLVPEIGLTPQTIGRFERRFAVAIAVLHSGLTDRERLQAWCDTASGRARIVIGTRSAIFTPLPEAGIIIVDEEHDPSFKQQDGVRYSARDLASVRASRQDIPLILGSATPALETLHNAMHQRFQHLRLTRRAGSARAPQIALLDIRRLPLQEGFSPAMLAEIEATLARREQVLVFINRRGFAPTLICHDCGWVAGCNHCDARLTVHQYPPHLHCHHCDHQRPLIQQCPQCFSRQLQQVGLGTERSELFLQQCFATTPIHRIDRDSTRRKNALAKVLEDVQRGDPCILVGTQMLAKGHHLPRVTLVAIVDADSGLLSTDLRGPERMGQLLIQVAGRAGRAERPGRVVIQSHHCDHPLMQLLVTRGYQAFARQLLAQRQLSGMPPYRYLALLRAESKRPENAIDFLTEARRLAQQLQPASPQLHYLGPLPALMEKRNGRFRYQLHVNAAARRDLHRLLQRLCRQLEANPLSRRVRWAVDVDPQDMT
ncbi:primosomal protein N' [Exilibacterium tricleocarpae]|uniref:Replication restart protein PriA n=1 Tax=Exilibacterium tricleocarpae TaxID=2591008 RepID=A0A545T603_9GAMM|nr:primosomal protein N' [Exilibacterium tricleocarpae]TQV72660.1 primosomal protein N' [Exilibacterium tricleocarpae]